MSKINVKNLLEKILEHLTDEFYVFVENEIQEVILEFVKHIDKTIGECQNYQQYFEELIMMKEFYEEKLK